MELRGKIVDVIGQPIVGAVVTLQSREHGCRSPDFDPMLEHASPRVRRQLLALRTSDDQGRFRCPVTEPTSVGKMATLRVTTKDNCEFEVNFEVGAEDDVIHVPTLVNSNVQTPNNVSAGELAGVVVDGDGNPLEGVEVDVWDWYPGNEITTGNDGMFRLKDLDPERKVQVRFRKPGYSPEMFVRQPTGISGWVVALSDKTYLEGFVCGPDGKPAAGAVLRANQGPKWADGVKITTVWTDTTADASGRYRLYVQPDEYELLVMGKGGGVARLPKRPIPHGMASNLDIQLQRGVTFRARVVDSESGQPVSNVRLWNRQHEGVEGRSDVNGLITIEEMLPGEFKFSVKAEGFSRWWSDEANDKRYRRPGDHPEWIHQGAFHPLEFEMRPEMDTVTIVVEKGVRIRGQIVDPDGKPVVGATTSLRLPGTHTFFSATSKQDGSFDFLAPASHKSQCNLIGHDGEIVKDEWRGWANGVLPPFQTIPGQEINGIELRLTRPATVRGRVVDEQGEPVIGCEVCAEAADNLEDRHCNPRTVTNDDGTFELRYLRPGEHDIRIEDADNEFAKRVTVQADQVLTDLELITGSQTYETVEDIEVDFVDDCSASTDTPDTQEFHFQVVTIQGEPVCGAKVALWAVQLAAIRGTMSPAQELFPSMTTDVDGFLRIDFSVKDDSPLAFFSQECIRLGIEGFGLAIDHPEHPLWMDYATIRRDAKIVLLDSAIVEVRAHFGDEAGLLQNLYPALSATVPDWSETDGVLTIRRVNLSGERPSRWLRIVHVPERGPALYSNLIDLKEHGGSAISLEVSLRQGCRVAGRIAENVPRPVKNGKVVACIVAGTDAWTNWEWEAVAEIAPDGTFVLESLSVDEHLQLIALCDGWVSESPSKTEVENYAVEHDLADLCYEGPFAMLVFPRLYLLQGTDIHPVVPMQLTSACEVTVLGPDGKPLPDASVSFSPNQVFFNSGSTILGNGSDRLANVREQLASGKHETSPHRGRDRSQYFAMTDTRGIAYIPNLPTGTANQRNDPQAFRFEVSHEQYDAPSSSPWGAEATANFLPGQTARVVVRMRAK